MRNKIIKYRDLRIYNINYKSKLIKKFINVINSGQFIMGNKVRELEDEISKYVGNKYCLGVSSGTDALYLSLKALNIGVGDEVICPAISWIATANSIAMTGATPVFVDVVLSDQNINVDLIENSITRRTKAIMPVHFLGRIANMDKIKKIAKKYNLKVIEDASQAFGAKQNHLFAGTIGDIGAISLNPMKAFAGYGENGIILTNSKKIFDKLVDLRYLGASKEICNYISLNFKIDEIQASLLSLSLKNLKSKIKYYHKLYALYHSLLSKIYICPPFPDEETTGYDFQILTKNRNQMIKYLHSFGIETKIKHPITQPNQPIYKKLNKKFSFPNAEYIVKHSISLPLHTNLSIREVEFIVNKIIDFKK